MNFDEALRTLHGWIGETVQVAIYPDSGLASTATFFGELGVIPEPIDEPDQHIYWFTIGRRGQLHLPANLPEEIRMRGSTLTMLLDTTRVDIAPLR